MLRADDVCGASASWIQLAMLITYFAGARGAAAFGGQVHKRVAGREYRSTPEICLLLHRRYTCVAPAQHKEDAVDPEMLDVSLHERRVAHQMENPEFRAAYEQTTREIVQTDEVIRTLDALRINLGVSKAELARRVNRNASSIRRLFTADRPRPELPLVVALADALGAELRVVPLDSQTQPTERNGSQARRVAGTA